MTLTDTSPFPFEMYKGKPMQDIPTSYLHWYWEAGGRWNPEQLAIVEYIRENMDALKMEEPDLIWSRK